MEQTTKKRHSINIGINTTSAVAGGGVTYLNNLIKYLSAFDKQNRYYIYVNPDVISKIQGDVDKNSNFKWITHKIPSISPFFRIFWEQLILPIYLKKNRIQILFCPANIGLVFWFIPFILMVRNMAVFDNDFIKHEDIYQRFRLRILRILTVFSIKKAKKIIFISKNAQDQICERYNIDRSKTVLIYHGKDERFNLHLSSIQHPESSIQNPESRIQNPASRIQNPESSIQNPASSIQNPASRIRHPVNTPDIEKIKKRYRLNNYILYVSNIYRYKNFYELILAFLKIKDQLDNDTQLIFAGISFDDLYYARLRELIAKDCSEGRIRFIGHVPNDHLPILYANSQLFVYPSTIENCPNILIEAMGCGASIVSSNIEPMPEICQNAALYFNPNDPDDIADKMLIAMRSRELRKNLSMMALERARFFSWEKTAQETLKVFKEVSS